jgi:hypothetical protein
MQQGEMEGVGEKRGKGGPSHIPFLTVGWRHYRNEYGESEGGERGGNLYDAHVVLVARLVLHDLQQAGIQSLTPPRPLTWQRP